MADDRGAFGVLDLWREMSPGERQAVAAAFWSDAESVGQQVEAIHAMATQFKFRPQSVLKLPPDRRARQLSAMSRIPESVASRALVVYHLAEKRAMLGAFLDALGIRHDHGVIEEVPAEPPGLDRLASAVAAISAAFPASDVRLYLRTLAAQDPGTWRHLRELAPAPAH
ncbi:MAG: hypothetical protein AB1806_12140 [Acidobacteriota bacterium]